MFLSFCGKVPRNEGAAFVAPNATVQGDVILKAGSTVWYGAVLRGDDGTLTIGENSNVQDNAVLHCDVGGAVTLGKSRKGHQAGEPRTGRGQPAQRRPLRGARQASRRRACQGLTLCRFYSFLPHFFVFPPKSRHFN